jgi:hypothetical protein
MTTPHTVTGRNACVMFCDFGLRGFAAACSFQKPGVRQTTGTVVLVVLLVLVEVELLVLLDVLELVELDVLLDVLELVELLVLLEVLELVELLVLLDVLELVLLEVLELVELDVLLDVLELVELDVLLDVVVVDTPVPSCFSERNGWSLSGVSCSRPSAMLSTAPDWSPARASETASVTPGFTLITHMMSPPTCIDGVPAGSVRFVASMTGLAKSGAPVASGQ